MTHVYIFGDSITYGCNDDAGGWVQHVRNKVDCRNNSEEDFFCLIYNLGISGDTSAGILERMTREREARISSDPEEPEIVLVAVGVNDSAYLVEEDRPRVTEGEFQQNIIKIHQVAESWGAQVGFIGLFPIDQSAVDPVPWAPQFAYRNCQVEIFNRIIEQTCDSTGAEFVTLQHIWTETNAKDFLPDGIHPGREGHALVAQAVEPLFQKYELT